MSLERCLAEVSYQEYKGWQWYFANDHLDVLDRSDLYAMQIAQEIVKVNAGKDAIKVKLEHYYLRGSSKRKILMGVPEKPVLIPLRLQSEEGKSDHQKQIERAMFKSVWGARIKAGEDGIPSPRKSSK